ncbi:glycine cleavage system aminomethyltransferase GcvT [Cyanobium sp. NIES-981]|uniref:glycine cleavage system aminomethyltransferase GcvT n=1 Tax=Cyanobium sp. NIES-981 TaxID=1851505 RepID=UPI0007DCD7D1|nr:glycine cleavage system aminomethyltransferase GcvT [Cyanobium sp. NIES-981]SBO44208.1 Aminomethyltransferase [Cyanobium sp. NIES-981]
MDLQRTPLHAAIQAAGARLVPFAGWEMPVQFAGLVAEHQAVRQRCGVFDISHMGVLSLRGDGAKDALQGLVPTDLFRIGPGEACYTVLLNEEGGIRDDLIVYDRGRRADAGGEISEELVLVINAACADSDTAWIRSQLEPLGISIADRKGDGVLLALQGPQAQSRLETLSGTSLEGLPRFGHRELELAGCTAFVGRTGYTGEDGFELLLPRAAGIALWQQLVEEGVTPCGLGARDTLRLEAAMHLYGQEMDARTTPLEAGLGWLVHLEMPKPFVGREVLERQSAEGVRRRLVGLKLQGRAIARHGYPVLRNGETVGEVTSGTWSPTLGEAIALAYVPVEAARLGTELAVEIRGRAEPALVVKRPFYRR